MTSRRSIGEQRNRGTSGQESSGSLPAPVRPFGQPRSTIRSNGLLSSPSIAGGIRVYITNHAQLRRGRTIHRDTEQRPLSVHKPRTVRNIMAQLVGNGATLQCSFGVAPSTMSVLPVAMVNRLNMPAATIMDHIPGANIIPFGMCSAPSNPQVAAATTAAAGVLTPQPCIPVTAAPWIPGSPTVLISKKPALNSTCQLMCTWGGAITITSAGQATVNVP